MKIGIIKESKIPPDRRVSIAPEGCVKLKKRFSELEFIIAPSDIRKIEDKEYEEQGLTISKDLSSCDVIIGVKEVSISDLIPNKTFMFFSHTIKEQPYNKNLLKAIVEKSIRLIDYETLTDKKNNRLIGFGRFAGIVGCYNVFYAYGKKHKTFDLKRAYKLNRLNELHKELEKVILPNNFKIVTTGTGKVSKGVFEMLKGMKIKEIKNAKDFINETFQEPVFIGLNTKQYTKPKNENNNANLYTQPELFDNNFQDFCKVANIYIAGHFWGAGAPEIISNEDLKTSSLEVIADISCDIKGPIASTIRPSTIENPLYGYDFELGKECEFDKKGKITVMAIDNLPCELPYDASKEFSNDMVNVIIPELINPNSTIIENATICKGGVLTKKYNYLTDYLNS